MMQRVRRSPFLYRALVALRRVAGRAWMRAANRVLGVKPNRVFFSSFKGKAYSDSPRFISEALHRLRPDVEIVWQLADPASAPEYVRAVRPHTLRALAMIASSRWIVDNFNRPQYMLLFRGQSYMQTWHGDRGFKKMLFDMDPAAGYPDGGQITLALSGSEFGTKNYRSAFRYEGPVLQLGMPRNDRLVHPDEAEIAAIRARLGIPDGARVMLYAPTFRDATSGQAQRAGFDLRRALSRLEAATGTRWVCLTRAHDQNLSIDAGDSAGAVRDVTRYPEMSDLLLAADLLITDYSSSAGDFILLDRPVILYQPDLAEFTSGDRDMYFDLRACPYARAESPEALDALLDSVDSLAPRCAAVRAFYGVTESGESAAAAAREIAKDLPGAHSDSGR